MVIPKVFHFPADIYKFVTRTKVSHIESLLQIFKALCNPRFRKCMHKNSTFAGYGKLFLFPDVRLSNHTKSLVCHMVMVIPKVFRFQKIGFPIPIILNHFSYFQYIVQPKNLDYRVIIRKKLNSDLRPTGVRSMR